MSEAEADVDDQEEPEQPSIDEDEMADLDSIAEEVEREAGAADGDQEDVDDPDRESSKDLELDADDARTSIGDVYCNVLGMSAAVAKDELGSGLEGDRKDALDEYADIARDLEIDEAVDDLIEEYGGPDQLSPGQTVIVMTVVFTGVVAMDDPEILEGLADR